MNTRITPLDFDKDGKPKDGRLFVAAVAYCEREFGAEKEPGQYLNWMASGHSRCWVIEAWDENYCEVIGICGIRNAIDLATFHITPVTANKEGLRLAEQARDLAVYRVSSYIQDLGLRGSQVLIYVAPERERFWRRFLARIKAVPACRYIVSIG